MVRRVMWLAMVVAACAVTAVAQDEPLYQTDFPAAELTARRAAVMEAIGDRAMALVQGAAAPRGGALFRQSNSFYYLTGLELPHAYLLLDGRNGTSTLYLPHRDPGRERHEGRLLGAEDADLVMRLTGVDQVRPVETMARDFTWTLVRLPAPVMYTPHSPAEGAVESRDELIGGSAGIASDPWDGRGTREAHFIGLLHERFPQMEIRDLSPILDDLRMIKSPREVELIRRASRLAGLGLMEAMRSTEPGVMEYQLAAAARYVHAAGGARWDAYSAIVGGGTNAWFGHYSRNDAPLEAGDLVLMDYAPDYHYYASDVTRMWPVSGRYTPEQRQLAEFILALHRAILAHMRPGMTAVEIQDEAVAEVRPLLERAPFAKPAYQRAAEAALDWRGHLSHPVGMSVHDVGNYKAAPLKAGTVIAVDPMMWIEEERLYVRIEDVVVVTEDGIDNLSAFVPSDPDEIERVMAEEGLVQKVPPVRFDAGSVSR